MSAFYNLHDFIRVSIQGGKLKLSDGYNHYLRYFLTNKELLNIDYEVKEFSEFTYPTEYNTVGDGIGFNNGICLMKEKYAVVFSDNKITEYTTYPNRATNLWLQLLLLRQRKSFIHGAGVEINGQGIVFPAYGGTGKTILISELRKLPNCKIFGDDYVIVEGNSRMFSYPSDFSIYPYHVTIFPELQGSIYSSYLYRRRIFSWYYLCKKVINFIWKRLSSSGIPLLPGWTADYVKVPAVNLIGEDKIVGETKLTTAVFLQRYNGTEIKIEEISLDKITNLVDGILWLEMQHAMPYLETLAACGLVDLSDIVISQKKVLRDCFTPLKLFKVNIPQKMDRVDYVQHMVRLIPTILQ